MEEPIDEHHDEPTIPEDQPKCLSCHVDPATYICSPCEHLTLCRKCAMKQATVSSFHTPEATEDPRLQLIIHVHCNGVLLVGGSSQASSFDQRTAAPGPVRTSRLCRVCIAGWKVQDVPQVLFWSPTL